MFNIDISDRTYFELLAATGGLYLMVYGNGKRSQHARLIKKGIRVAGEVVDIKIKSRPGMSPDYYPVIRFDTIDKGPYKADYDFTASNPCLYKLWETVTVVYDPADHTNFTVDNNSSKYAGALMMLMGIAVIAAAIIYYIFDPASYLRF